MKELPLWVFSEERKRDEQFRKDLETEARFDRLERALNEVIRQSNNREQVEFSKSRQLAKKIEEEIRERLKRDDVTRDNPAERLTATGLAKQQKPGF